MGKFTDQRIYRTFEEFEREELRRDGYFAGVDDMMDTMFAGELDFSDDDARKSRRRDEEEREHENEAAARCHRSRLARPGSGLARWLSSPFEIQGLSKNRGARRSRARVDVCPA